MKRVALAGLLALPRTAASRPFELDLPAPLPAPALADHDRNELQLPPRQRGPAVQVGPEGEGHAQVAPAVVGGVVGGHDYAHAD